jgi:hypothetical protein
MSKKSFSKLLHLIRDDIEVNQEMAMRRGGAIIPELCLYCTIRWLAGGSYSDIFYFTGMSSSSFYRILWKTIEAINNCSDPYIKIKFPKTEPECNTLAKGFMSVSTNGCIQNCVAAIDGYLLAINAPAKKKDGINVRSFFSGHYQRYGVNIQAACDHHSRFLFVAVAGPGQMGDRMACNECGLYDLVENLPGRYAAIADCAYKSTEHMIPIYGGNDATNKQNDTFNFFASQLRIRIEMAFGMMVKKWCILQKPAMIKLDHVSDLIISIATLHNFCINERLSASRHQKRRQTDDDDEITFLGYSHRMAMAEIEFQSHPQDQWVNWSSNRENMKKIIISLKLERPMPNHSKAKAQANISTT